MRPVNLAVPIFQAHSVGILAIDPRVSLARTVAAKADAVTGVDGVTHLAAPHTLLWVTSTFLSDLVAEGGSYLLDACCREGGGDVKGSVNVMLKTPYGVRCG